MDMLDRHRNQVAYDVEHTFAQFFSRLGGPNTHGNSGQNLTPRKGLVLSNRMDSGGSEVENTGLKMSGGKSRRKSSITPQPNHPMKTRSMTITEEGTVI